MNRILLVDLGERELKKRVKFRSKLSELCGSGHELNADVRFVLVDFGESSSVLGGSDAVHKGSRQSEAVSKRSGA